ncbi:MAG: hypothetical protein WKG32_14565 [Gemmatimonadaceae bacterium]
MRSLSGQPVFSVGREQYCWEDVVLADILWGGWAALEEDVRAGLACTRRLERLGRTVPAQEVNEAASAFRYERDLVAAEDAAAWLRKWRLDAEDWLGYLRRSILRRRWQGKLAELTGEFPATALEVESAIMAEAVCSGRLDRAARKLAARAAVYERLAEQSEGENGDEWTDDGLSRELERFPESMVQRALAGLPEDQVRARMTVVARLELALRRFREVVSTPRAIEERVGLHHLDWIRFEYQSLAFAREEAAREAALCLREDGLALATVAAESNAPLWAAECYLDQVDAPLRPRFLGAREGELVGPVELSGEFTLFQIIRKRLPSPSDPETRRRAEESVVRGAAAYELQQRVRWQT